jgi:hypothetical protein
LADLSEFRTFMAIPKLYGNGKQELYGKTPA